MNVVRVWMRPQPAEISLAPLTERGLATRNAFSLVTNDSQDPVVAWRCGNGRFPGPEPDVDGGESTRPPGRRGARTTRWRGRGAGSPGFRVPSARWLGVIGAGCTATTWLPRSAATPGQDIEVMTEDDFIRSL